MPDKCPIVEQDPIYFYRSIGDYGFLSNLYKVPIEFEGRTFRSAEDACQYGKPKDLAVAEWLVSAPSPHLTAIAAHALLPWDIRPDWTEIKDSRMFRILCFKFSQYPTLLKDLLATGDRILIENSQTDGYWGIGKNQKGKNMLGLMLMDIRKRLRDLDNALVPTPAPKEE